MPNMQDIADALIKGNAKTVAELCRKAMAEGEQAKDVLDRGLIAGMGVIGRRFKANQVYVPEVLIAARAMKAGMEVLQPCLTAAGVKPIATVVLGTVKGDLHDIGKNLVAMMLNGNGFHVVDAGIDVSAERFADICSGENASICGMSALLTTTMTYMRDIVRTVREKNPAVRTMIGGAPLTQAFADEIGADAYAADAAGAVDVARELLGIA